MIQEFSVSQETAETTPPLTALAEDEQIFRDSVRDFADARVRRPGLERGERGGHEDRVAEPPQPDEERATYGARIEGNREAPAPHAGRSANCSS